MSKSFPCPCCGFLTISEEPPGTYEICPICYWEDDSVQFDDIDFEGGANLVNLRQARENFKSFGASEQRFLKEVRAPKQDEVPS